MVSKQEIKRRFFGVEAPSPLVEAAKILAAEAAERQLPSGSYDGGARTSAAAPPVGGNEMLRDRLAKRRGAPTQPTYIN